MQNADLDADLDRAIADWAQCAAQIDAFVKCQEEDRAQAR